MVPGALKQWVTPVEFKDDLAEYTEELVLRWNMSWEDFWRYYAMLFLSQVIPNWSDQWTKVFPLWLSHSSLELCVF